MLISFLFNAYDNDRFEALYSVCKKWPLLHRYFAFLIDGVLIESADAAQARNLRRQTEEMRERTPPPAVANIPAATAGLLARAENGEWQAWCWLNLILMLTPTSPAIVEEVN
jgi:hypothetical protein